MRMRTIPWAMVIGAGALSATAQGQCLYDVDGANGPNCGIFGPALTLGRGLNAVGDAVGYHRKCPPNDGQFVAVRWTEEEGMVPLTGFPTDTNSSEAYDINDARQIIGRYSVPDDDLGPLGFLIQGDEFTSLGTFPYGNYSWPKAINERGEIVGYAGHNVTGPVEAFLWRDGAMQTLEGMPKGPSRARDINDKGQVVGRYTPTTEGGGVVRRAFLWDNGTFTDIGVIPGGISGQAMAINNHGYVVGFGRINLPEGGFIRKPFIWIDGEMSVINLPPEVEGWYETFDINDHGQVLFGIFIWQDGVITYLPDLVPPDVVAKGAVEITNEGVMVGWVNIPAGDPDAASYLTVYTPQAPPLTDLTGDCRTDADDLRMLLGQWGAVEDGAGDADFNHDGVVDPLDLAILLGSWG